jgi:regulator of protease activity HflC (stomatin/prohibitin superfamily)
MTSEHNPREYPLVLAVTSHWKRLAIAWLIIALMFLVIVLLTWNAFFTYVPPGKHLVIISKNGTALDPGEVLANEGQKGIQREVKGEGWHFVMPIIYATELEENTVIPPGKVGIVTAKGGKAPAPGRLLAELGEQGIQRLVLPPGAYRLNKHGYEVELTDAIDIKPGDVGVLRRMLGEEGQGRFAAEGGNEKGILRKVLQPGLYYINTKEFEVIQAEVGIYQTSFHKPTAGNARDTAITFTCKGGFPIDVDCTVEWEVLPEDMPSLVAEYGLVKDVEKKVIDVQAHAICRDKGIDYGVQDFLQGTTRERFQEDFAEELTRVCKEKNVTIHSAFIRRINIPEAYLKQIRDAQIAHETQLTNKAQEVTAQTEAAVEREKQMIEQEVARVQAETKLLVAGIDQEVKNVGIKVDAELEKMKADYQARIAALDAERTKVLGEADAQAKQMKDIATNNLYRLKLDVFQNDGNAFLRYTMGEKLNQDMVLRLFHSGAGTLWTNMNNKGMNFMMPISSGEPSKSATDLNQKEKLGKEE